MSHTRRHLIISALAPAFADPEIREALSAEQLTKIDAILQQDEFSRKDTRKVLAAAADAAFSDD